MPDDLKAQLEAAIGKMRLENWLWMESKNMEAVEFFKKNGVEIVVMEPESVATMVKWAHEYLDERAAKDEFFAKVWNSQKAFGKKWYTYNKSYSLPH